MRTLNELIRTVDVALDDDDWCEIEDIVIESIRHMPDFANDKYEQWNINDIKDLIQDIGEKVYRKWGVRELKNIHLSVECELGDYAARYLAVFWNSYGAYDWSN